jgi:hypothetical protein
MKNNLSFCYELSEWQKYAANPQGGREINNRKLCNMDYI